MLGLIWGYSTFKGLFWLSGFGGIKPYLGLSNLLVRRPPYNKDRGYLSEILKGPITASNILFVGVVSIIIFLTPKMYHLLKAAHLLPYLFGSVPQKVLQILPPWTIRGLFSLYFGKN